jgi:hypothetical protein
MRCVPVPVFISWQLLARHRRDVCPVKRTALLPAIGLPVQSVAISLPFVPIGNGIAFWLREIVAGDLIYERIADFSV